jgi:hypothetical protein
MVVVHLVEVGEIPMIPVANKVLAYILPARSLRKLVAAMRGDISSPLNDPLRRRFQCRLRS